MIEIVRYGREQLIHQEGCSRRLATRLGALMAKQVTISATLLEEARPASSLEKLLLKKELLDSSDLKETLGRLLRGKGFSKLRKEMPLVIIEQGGWQVIAAEEETLAEDGWSEAGEAEAVEAPEENRTYLPSLAADPSLARPAPAEKDGSFGEVSAFTPAEVARLRVNIFAGAGSTEKVAALRQFSFASVPTREKISVFLQAMAGEDAALRASAAQGLRVLGLPADIADAARLLAEGDPAERGLAVERLRDLAEAAPELGRDAILMAIFGTLRDPGVSAELFTVILEVLGAVSLFLGKIRICRDDILRVILERVISADPARSSAIRGAVKAMDAVQPGWAVNYLVSELRQTKSRKYQAVLLEILIGLELAREQRDELVLIVAGAYFARSCDDREGQMFSAFLVASGDAGVKILVERLAQADTAHQRHLVRLFDNALRRGVVSAETRELIAVSGLALLRKGHKQVRNDVLETSICARDDLPQALRRDIAKAFLRELHDYAHWPLAGIMRDALVRLGAPAAEPLLATLGERKNIQQAEVLVAALGLIGQDLASAPAGEGSRPAEVILRELQKLSFSSTAAPYLGSLYLAMGRICSGAGISPEVANLILRTLFNRLEGVEVEAPMVEALGWACRGEGTAESDLRIAADLALAHLGEVQPEPTMEMARKNGEDIFVFGPETGIYAELIPACLSLLENLALNQRTPDVLREELVETLLARWEKNISFELQWGPANVTRLTEALGRIGASRVITGSLRLRIAHTLSRRASEIPVLRALAAILALGEASRELDRLAGAMVLRLLKVLDEADAITLDDHEAFLRLLGRIGLRGRFEIRGGGVDRLLERLIDALLAGGRQGISGCHQDLARLLKAKTLPEPHLRRIEEELKRFSALALRR